VHATVIPRARAESRLADRAEVSDRVAPAKPTVRLGLAEVLPAGLFLKPMHSSDFCSPTRRMTFACTPPLCADHYRISSLFDSSTAELYRSPFILAQTFSAFHGSFHLTKLFPIPSPACQSLTATFPSCCMNHAGHMHIPCIQDEPASRAGFSLVFFLCGPPCLASPRVSSKQGTCINPNVRSECSSKTTNKQSSQRHLQGCSLCIHNVLCPIPTCIHTVFARFGASGD
jgi:hypothetical protein